MTNLSLIDAPADPSPPSVHAGATTEVDGHVVPARLEIGCRFEFDVPAPVHAIVLVEPHESEGGRVVNERFDAPPGGATSTFRDVFGNQCRRLVLPAGHAEFTYAATVSNDAGFDAVDVHAEESEPGDLPDEVLQFLLPSRYCPSDELAAVACDRFGAADRGWGRVESIVSWAHEHLTFRYGSSSPTKTAAEAYRDRTGVCRDFAHLTITMCRALNVPAAVRRRLPPRHRRARPGHADGLLRLERGLPRRALVHVRSPQPRPAPDRAHRHRSGRDAADVAMTTTFGQARLLEMTVCAGAASR